MPELPEVEVTRIGLADRIAGARVIGARKGKPLRWPLGCRAESLQGMSIGALARRGKYLWMPLRAEAREGGLLWHLGMSGSLALLPPPAPEPGSHDHFDLVTTAGTLRLTDPRRFGAVIWSAAIDQGFARGLLQGLGPEPFDPALTAERLHQACRRRRGSIKQALLSGELVVGAGNIYACEALFHAGIDPRTRSHRLSRARLERLLAAVRHVLARAIALGGSTLRDFRNAHGVAGAFQAEAQVYGRTDQPCRVCGTPVRRIIQAQRSTYFCPNCQHR
jgi:formamidopyrimidine-DNA glycosylase